MKVHRVSLEKLRRFKHRLRIGMLSSLTNMLTRLPGAVYAANLAGPTNTLALRGHTEPRRRQYSHLPSMRTNTLVMLRGHTEPREKPQQRPGPTGHMSMRGMWTVMLLRPRTAPFWTHHCGHTGMPAMCGTMKYCGRLCLDILNGRSTTPVMWALLPSMPGPP